jgi:ATP-dependent Clp protease ATP-binding subunit ClpA
MSEFLHLDQVKLFVGNESGQTGRLRTVLSKCCKGFLLFDEIEKSHNLVEDLFLRIIGDARITLADDKTYDLSGVYIVCTSNIGSEFLLLPTRLPFVRLESSVLGKLSLNFRPEFVGRFTEKIVFKPLSIDTQIQIGKLTIEEELRRFRAKGFYRAMDILHLAFALRLAVTELLIFDENQRCVALTEGLAVGP